MSILIAVLRAVLNFYLLLLWARFFVEFAVSVLRTWRPSDGMVIVMELLMTVTDPPVKFFRKIVPPLRIGPVALDFGVFLAIAVVSLIVTLLGVLG
ncbi:MAG: YggT family protein [Microbacteriaceae bacterium]|nr:YggT family protein [Microbacteriaceae bacterium]MCI1207405.1 YggT family protein [Microbacteriaceae bacterium]